jgi:hypothetical protein
MHRPNTDEITQSLSPCQTICPAPGVDQLHTPVVDLNCRHWMALVAGNRSGLPGRSNHHLLRSITASFAQSVPGMPTPELPWIGTNTLAIATVRPPEIVVEFQSAIRSFAMRTSS